MNPTIFPAPREMSFGETTLDLGEAAWIVLHPACSRQLRERVQEASGRIANAFNRPVRVAAAKPQGVVALVTITLNPELPAQGYKLILEENRRQLLAGDEAGAYYGMLALGQILEQCGTTVPVLSVTDSPDFPARGVMLDVSRCKVPTMATLKALIDRLARMRINQVQLYIEHTFAFAAHKTVWHDASPFTHEEILELDQFCQDRFIALVPNFNSFGHFDRWLRHPEYRHLAECPDGYTHPDGETFPYGSTLYPGRESLRFLEALYDEYLPHFSAELFNVGCDETWELGEGRSKKLVKKTSSTEVYVGFLKKIHKLVSKRGRKMQFWGDIILHQPELIKDLPGDMVALCWGYDADHPYDKECRAFAEAGVEFYVCPGTSAWNSLVGCTDNALANLENAARNGLKYGATGFLNTDWGDGGHHQILPASYLGLTAGAAYSWHLKTNVTVNLAAAVNDLFFQDHTGVLGQLCVDMGRILNKIPGLVQSNRSCLHELLFRDLRQLDLSKVTRTQYARAEAWLDKLEGDLARARPSCPDADAVVSEFAHILALSRYAVRRGLFAQYGVGDAEQLHRDHQNVIMSHEEQWLVRNRRGGLHESSTRLRDLAKPMTVGCT